MDLGRFTNKDGTVNREAVEDYVGLRKLNRKLDEALCKENMKLSNPKVSQEEKIDILMQRDARRRVEARMRQLPAISRRDSQNGVNVRPEPARTVLDDMQAKTASAHGFPTFEPSYQQFSDVELRVDPKLFTRTGGNETASGSSYYKSFHYSMTEEMSKNRRVEPSFEMRRKMPQSQASAVNTAVSSIRRQKTNRPGSVRSMYEGFLASNDSFTPEQKYLVGFDLGVFAEDWNGTAGEWVVVMPYSTPKSLDEFMYNQNGGKGGSPAEVLEVRQSSTYGRRGEKDPEPAQLKTVPSATPDNSKSTTEYKSGDKRSRDSLMDPDRGEDIIRMSNARSELEYQERMKRHASAEAKKKDQDKMRVEAYAQMFSNLQERKGETKSTKTTALGQNNPFQPSAQETFDKTGTRHSALMKSAMDILEGDDPLGRSMGAMGQDAPEDLNPHHRPKRRGIL